MFNLPNLNINLSNLLNDLITQTLSGLLSALLIFIVTAIIVKAITKNKLEKVLYQNYFYAKSDYIFIGYKDKCIGDLPQCLLKYREKISPENDEGILSIWKTQISTFFVFTDGKHIILFNREEAEKEKDVSKKIVVNDKLDCHGAKVFHNESLKTKLPQDFLSCNIIDIKQIPGFALEKKAKTIFNLPILTTKNSVVMLGFVVYLTEESLLKGLNIKNELFDLSNLSPDEQNLTAKAKLAIKYLKNNATKIDQTS